VGNLEPGKVSSGFSLKLPGKLMQETIFMLKHFEKSKVTDSLTKP
jgi:hypothetical protein